MDQSPALVWTCLLGAAITLALPPAVSLTTSKKAPRPPQLIGCVFLNRANVTCHWEQGDTLWTGYTLQIERRPWNHRASISRNVTLKTFSCTTSGTSCTAQLNGSSVRFTFCTTITAHGHSSNISSLTRCQSGRIEVMLPPVSLNSVKPVKGRPKCLNVTWSSTLSEFPVSHPEVKAGNLTSQIQFAEQGQFDVQDQNETVRDYSFLVCLPRPDTSYSIRLRHRYLGPKSPWSPWSNAAWGRTGEDAPSAAPAFWRQVKQTQKNGWRRISLLWKPLPGFLANGRVLFYNVTCHTESPHVLYDHGNCRDLNSTSTSCSLLLPAGRSSCALTASTSAGTSSEARIWLPGASEREPPSLSNLTACSLDDSRLDVRWMAPVGWPVRGYVVEWFAVREKNSSSLQWEMLNSSCTALVITEGVKALERYAVSVRVLYGDRGAGQNRTVFVYTRQGAPSAGPTVKVKQISGSTVELTWSPVPVELLHGFIRNYTLYYTTANQPNRSVCLPGHAQSYSLRNLSPGNYHIFIMANTDAGSGAAGPIANVHIGSEEVSIAIRAVLPLILTSLMLVLLVFLAQTKMVKQKLFQDVPNPSHSSLAHWTPKTALESTRQWAIVDEPEIQYSEVFLLGERDLQNSSLEMDFAYKSLCNLKTYPSHCYSQLPLSEAQSYNRKSEKKCINSLSGADLSLCPSIYSDVIFSQYLKSLPKPSHPLQYNEWHHSSVSISDIKLQLGGECDLNVCLQSSSDTKSDSLLSQTDELKRFCHLQRQNQSSDCSSISLSSVLPFRPAEVKSPRKPYSKSLYNSFPSLQPDSFIHPDALCDTVSFLQFPPSVFVDFSSCPIECGTYISPAL
ncbi:interleukin-6 receptor subunit beta [Labrus mixtus]|uniref:interleukin-6 receptor subunit beta n=1 Tax=Labrus mixtus TaxID=508554 RepID=UPI0029C025D8|nr:interleukin-6 receptor subunit beta [Labrus mixtus]